MIVSTAAVMLSAMPVSGMEQVAIPGNGQVFQEELRHLKPEAKAAVVGQRNWMRSEDPHLRYGKEAIHLALQELTKVLTDKYYEKYGGFFITRGFIARRVNKEIQKRGEAICKLVEDKYSSPHHPLQFNLQTALVTYSENQCLRTATISEIADLVMKFREGCDKK